MEFKEYLAIIRRRWLLFFPIFLLIVAAHLVWVSYGQENRYSATSKVIIGADRALSTQGAANLPMPLQGLSAGTKEATLTDYPVLKRASELAVGARDFESSPFHDANLHQQIRATQEIMREKHGDDADAIEKIIEELGESVAIGRHADRQIVEIQVEGAEAAETLLLSWAMAEGAHQFHDAQARESVDSYLGELTRKIQKAEENANEAQNELAEAKKQIGIASLEEKERMILQNIYRIEDQDSKLLAQTRKNDRLIQNRLQEQQFGGRVDLSPAASAENAGRLGDIRERLFQAKLDYDSQVSTLTARHPEVQKTRALITGLEKAMAREQEVVLAEKYKVFSRETNELIKENALFALEREVITERKARLNQELFNLTSVRQDLDPKELAFQESQERLNYLVGLQKDVMWFAEGNLGSVVVYDPAVQANPMALRGVGFGPLTLTLLMAFIFSIGVVYIVEYVDTRVKTEHDIRRHLNLPLLGVIPKETVGERLLTEAPLQSEISEKFNTAATLIQSTARELNLKALMVCSAIAREGKTTISVNLAVALARKGSRVVLIDGDLRISQLHNVVGASNTVGLANVLETKVDATQFFDSVMTDEALQGGQMDPLSVVQKTAIENLDVITAGAGAQDPVHLLESGRLDRLVTELKQHYDFVIFDTPPINKVGDALTISSVVDGSIFVVASGQAEQHDVMWAKHLLTNVQANILGVFLNKFAKQKGGEYYYYYYYNDSKRKRIKSRA